MSEFFPRSIWAYGLPLGDKYKSVTIWNENLFDQQCVQRTSYIHNVSLPGSFLCFETIGQIEMRLLLARK
ncbi:hypothetical protein H5410_012861 [Solanum commersonii]|uniref:Uncharacterized protein n=1 Tax=Solanum commersonii TaxID=4109 RepID=A0A9J6ATM2_SOLCO|nr:hypothetical protein H5410_012861 [Solanum commersonii]